MTRSGLSGYPRRVNSAILFAVLSGLSAATWTICLKLGSSRISAVLGAMVITGVAFVVNSIALLGMRAGGHDVVLTREGLWLLAVAGVAASGVDIFGLLAYERGLRVTSSFLIGGTSTVVVLLVGFLVLHEPLTWGRLAAIAMIVGGHAPVPAPGALADGAGLPRRHRRRPVDPWRPRFDDAQVAAAFRAYPRGVAAKLRALRRLIFDVASRTDGVGELEETLKWGSRATSRRARGAAAPSASTG